MKYSFNSKATRLQMIYHAHMDETNRAKCGRPVINQIVVGSVPQNRRPCIKCFGKPKKVKS